MTTRARQPAAAPSPSRARAAWSRGAVYFGLWLVMMPSLKPKDLAVGVLAAAGAAWVSLRLLPPEAGGIRLGVLVRLVPRLFWAGVLAGVDVARRALGPRVRLDPGFVEYSVGLPPGFARNTFATITGMAPGTVPVDEEPDLLVYHCLDVTQPVVEQMGKDERTIGQALVPGRSHD